MAVKVLLAQSMLVREETSLSSPVLDGLKKVSALCLACLLCWPTCQRSSPHLLSRTGAPWSLCMRQPASPLPAPLAGGGRHAEYPAPQLHHLLWPLHSPTRYGDW